MYPIIYPELKIIFFYSPKCACSSIKTFIQSLRSKEIVLNIHSVIGSDNIKDLSKFSSYEKILFVRDPFERIVSAFISMYGYYGQDAYNWLSDKFVQWFWEKFNCNNANYCPIEQIIRFRINPSFRNFILILNSTNVYYMNPHISPQITPYNCPKLSKTDFTQIINISNLNTELANFNIRHHTEGKILSLNKLSYDASQTPMADTNIVIYGRTHKSFPPWENFYDKDLRLMVGKIYAEDISIIKSF